MRRLVLAFLLLASPALAAGTLRVGMQDDVDVLDPARSAGLPDRVVLAALCDKLIDVDAKLTLVPQLATGWTWAPDNLSLTVTLRDGVRFHDGAMLDAEAVRANLERYRTHPRSVRRTELKPISAVEVVDSHTVRLRLSEPYAPLVSVLADRSGMMLSPVSIAAVGDGVATAPVCAGPFRFAERVAQDRIVLDRFPEYWDAGRIALDRVVYRPFPDSTVRLLNLRSGQLDIIERVAPTDAPAVKAEPRLRLVTSPSIAYRTLSINLNSGPAAQGPLGRDARVREAFELSIDRGVINQVVLEGQFIPSNQPEAPGSPYWNPGRPVPARDVARARDLLREAGQPNPAFTLTVGNNPVDVQTAEVIRSMAEEAGFRIAVQPMESVANFEANKRGDYQATMVIWSGRADPDGNIAYWVACNGFLNWGRYCNPRVDALLAEARSVTDPAARQGLYRQVIELVLADRPLLILYHYTWLWAASDRVEGFNPLPDGLIRLQGVRLR